MTNLEVLRTTHTRRVYARVGLVGNPSDNFAGKTLAAAIENFWAEVTLTPHHCVEIVPDASDPPTYESLGDLHRHVNEHGYYGTRRLFLATCHTLCQYCEERGIATPSGGFQLSYRTTIPRQCGLSGSSALVGAALSCLLAFFEIERQISALERPGLMLQAERSLGVVGGLQDRVVQCFGGAVFMDFGKGVPRPYRHVDARCLPPLWLLYLAGPSGKDSGAVHSGVKERWLAGDLAVAQGVQDLVRCAEEALALLDVDGGACCSADKEDCCFVDDGDCCSIRDHRAAQALPSGRFPAPTTSTPAQVKLGQLMGESLRIRHRLYGDRVLGRASLAMVAVARSVGAAVNFAGSGGAVVVHCPRGAEQEEALQRAAEEASETLPLRCERVRVAARVCEFDWPATPSGLGAESLRPGDG
ncbi:hypothetical protein H632_c100p3 [Helicosporidium sp. ATCC 50920]|nr:hypothetical protein H632_c100p3 [Helicosporidium sp. ATCC 50920]|eukprot:KDD76801.1 hypothetical protein H632_c100p3 [Helicosporidium sp. ATCC 50920]